MYPHHYPDWAVFRELCGIAERQKRLEERVSELEASSQRLRAGQRLEVWGAVLLGNVTLFGFVLTILSIVSD